MKTGSRTKVNEMYKVVELTDSSQVLPSFSLSLKESLGPKLPHPILHNGRAMGPLSYPGLQHHSHSLH